MCVSIVTHLLQLVVEVRGQKTTLGVGSYLLLCLEARSWLYVFCISRVARECLEVLLSPPGI